MKRVNLMHTHSVESSLEAQRYFLLRCARHMQDDEEDVIVVAVDMNAPH